MSADNQPAQVTQSSTVVALTNSLTKAPTANPNTKQPITVIATVEYCGCTHLLTNKSAHWQPWYQTTNHSHSQCRVLWLHSPTHRQKPPLPTTIPNNQSDTVIITVEHCSPHHWQRFHLLTRIPDNQSDIVTVKQWHHSPHHRQRPPLPTNKTTN